MKEKIWKILNMKVPNIVVFFLLITGIMLLVQFFSREHEIVKRFQNPTRYSEENKTPVYQKARIRKQLDPNVIKPYTESELRLKVKNWSTRESVVYNARLFANEHPHNRSAQQTWLETIIKQKPKLGQARFSACMHLADHDYQNSK